VTAEHLALTTAAVAAVSALGSIWSAWVSYLNGKRQVEGAQATAEKQIAAAHQQIESAQAVAKQQIESARNVARDQLVGPMREAWVDKLRAKLAWQVGARIHAYCEVGPDPEESRRLTINQTEISLLTNEDDPDHVALTQALGELSRAVREKYPETAYGNAVSVAISISRKVLRSEWRRAKSGE
jgi:hypothetical protein